MDDYDDGPTGKAPLVQHVRRPAPIWRTEAEYTECGRRLDAYPADRLIDSAELDRRVRQWGKQRASFSVCMTCWQTVGRWRSDRDDPILVTVRELEYVRHEPFGGDLSTIRPDVAEKIREDRVRRARVVAELRALAALVDKYRDEFDATVASLDEVDTLSERRAQRRKRRTR